MDLAIGVPGGYGAAMAVWFALSLLVDELNYLAFRGANDKSSRNNTGLIEMRAISEYPDHDNVYFIPRSRVHEVAQKLPLVRY